jgi:hypothetical protein
VARAVKRAWERTVARAVAQIVAARLRVIFGSLQTRMILNNFET